MSSATLTEEIGMSLSVSGRMSETSLKHRGKPCVRLAQGEEEFGCECVKPQREGMVLLSGVNMFPHRRAAMPRLLRKWWGHAGSAGDCTTRLHSEQQATLQPLVQAGQRILTLRIHACPSVSRTAQTQAPDKAPPTYANDLTGLSDIILDIRSPLAPL